MGHQEQPRSLGHHFLPLDARYPGGALSLSAAASFALRESACDASRSSPSRAPHSVLVAVLSAEAGLSGHALPCLGGERLSRRKVTAATKYPQRLFHPPRAALRLGRRRGWPLTGLQGVTRKVRPVPRCHFLKGCCGLPHLYPLTELSIGGGWSVFGEKEGRPRESPKWLIQKAVFYLYCHYVVRCGTLCVNTVAC